jgi:hypothetical protein
MKFIDSLEKRFSFLAVPNVVLMLIVAQLVMYAMILVGRIEFVSLLLFPKAVLGGEWWRMFSFIIAPPTVPQSLIQGVFLAFFWYIFWMMSTSLERAWGVFRFNLFLLVGGIFSVIGAFVGQVISPEAFVYVTQYFLYYSVFFAFATLNPNVQFLIFFVVPVKVKWLAWFLAAITAVTIMGAASWGQRLALFTPLLNYLLFFRGALTQSMANHQRQTQYKKEQRSTIDDALHTCCNCGASDRSHPNREFRYKIVEGDAMCICDSCRDE